MVPPVRDDARFIRMAYRLEFWRPWLPTLLTRRNRRSIDRSLDYEWGDNLDFSPSGNPD